MSAKLLTLTHHLNAKNLREDILFKKSSFDSSLIGSECFGLGSDIPSKLKPLKGVDGSGVTFGQIADGTQQVTFINVGFPAWQRPEFTSPSGPSDFARWFGGKVENLDDCQCMLFGGHHTLIGGIPWIWGREAARQGNSHNPLTAWVPAKSEDERPVLYIAGSRKKNDVDLGVRAGPFDCTKTLKNCRLIIVVGCNSIGWPGEPPTPALYWQEWASLKSGVKPIILGWYGPIGAPKDVHGESFSQPFWQELKTIAAGRDLKTLCEQEPIKVIKAWGQVLKNTYKVSKQRLLWFGGAQGAAAVDPSGKDWRVLKRNGELEKVS